MILKKISAVISLLLIVFSLSAQTIINNKALLKKELDSTVSLKNLPLNSIALSPAGDWIILFGDFGYSFVRTSPNIETKLAAYNKNKTYLKDIDFYKNAGWSLLTKHNAYTGDNIPEPIEKKLKEINKNKLTVKCIDFNTNESGVIIYGHNSYYSKGMPGTFHKKMRNLKYRNQRIKYAAVNEDGSWVILYGKYGFSYSKIDNSLAKKLKATAKQKKSINRIFLMNEYWLFTSENSKIDSNL